MATRKQKPVEVEAEVIEAEETAIAVTVMPATITADFASVEGKVRDMVASYDGLTVEAAQGMELEQLRRCHAELNALERKIDDARKEVKSQYEAPYKAFEAEVKRIKEIVEQPRLLIKKVIAGKEQAIKDDRRIHLEEVYFEFLNDNALPSFAANVEFDKVCDRKWWDTSAKQYNEKQYELELTDRVAEIMREWNAFNKVKPKLFDQDGAERVFWDTLSSVEAISYSTEQAERQKAVDALHEEAHGQEEAEHYVITVTMTPSQRDKVLGYLKQLGVKGKIRREQ